MTLPSLPLLRRVCPALFLLLAGASGPYAQDAPPVDWRTAQRQDSAFYGSAEAQRIADNLLVYQHATGGWPKNTDMATPLTAARVEEIENRKTDPKDDLGRPTIDNGATYPELRYLARVYKGNNEERYRSAFLRGVDYLLEAQYDNGGWPQFYPIREGYYENITFNDGAMIGAMKFLRDVAKGTYSFVDPERMAAAAAAVDRGVDVILKTQIEVDGKRTAWCAQHDPNTLEPAKARAYELVSISGSESVGVVEFLMEIENPRPEVVRAVTGAVEWFERVKLTGLRLIRQDDPLLPKQYDLVVGLDPEHGEALWARFYEIGTNYPMFVGRDGVVKYALSEIEYERRVGYAWLKDWAKDLLEEYPEWAAKHGIQ